LYLIAATRCVTTVLRFSLVQFAVKYCLLMLRLLTYMLRLLLRPKPLWFYPQTSDGMETKTCAAIHSGHLKRR
ncbi:MAG: hypothetical protein ACLSBB_16070, partial [Ruthenibacterium lactatiformans]